SSKDTPIRFAHPARSSVDPQAEEVPNMRGAMQLGPLHLVSKDLTSPCRSLRLGRSGGKWEGVGRMTYRTRDERLPRQLRAPGRRQGQAEPARAVSAWCR